MLKKAQVHMLPQERQTPRVNRILLHKTKNTLHYGVKATNDGMVALTQCSDDSLEWNGELIPHHLYFTTDETPKDSDWVLDIANGRVFQWLHSEYSVSTDYKKIIATTNPVLWDAIPLRVGSKSLSEIKTAKIPTDFIEAFVREQGNIKEVQLEYDDKYADVDSQLRNIPYLKLRNSGTVIIHKVKELIYTEEDMKAAFMAGRSHDDVYGFAEDEVRFHNDLDTWLENYKNS